MIRLEKEVIFFFSRKMRMNEPLKELGTWKGPWEGGGECSRKEEQVQSLEREWSVIFLKDQKEGQDDWRLLMRHRWWEMKLEEADQVGP